jgi:hypothetical protein
MLKKTLLYASREKFAEVPMQYLSTHHHLRQRMTTTIHTIGAVASLISLALFAAAIPRWNANFFHNKGPNKGDWTDGMPIGPLLVALIYHASVLTHTVGRIPQRKATPTTQAPIPLTLSRRSLVIHNILPTMILLSLAPSLFLAGYGGLFRFWRPAVRTQSGLLTCNMLNLFAKDCQPILYTVGRLQIAGIVFGCLVWMVHFVLLLVALRDLRRQRLITSLQREKLAHFEMGGSLSGDGHGRSHSSRRGKGLDARSGSESGHALPSTSTHTKVMHGKWHQYKSTIKPSSKTHSTGPTGAGVETNTAYKANNRRYPVQPPARSYSRSSR